jgi:hypothetical protein
VHQIAFFDRVVSFNFSRQFIRQGALQYGLTPAKVGEARLVLLLP